jgi:hypothetical protein
VAPLIKERSFVKIVTLKKSGINKHEAQKLFWSMALSIALFILGKRQSEQARAEQDKIQRELIKKINLSVLPEEYRNHFKRIEIRESEIREEAKNKYPPHIVERFVMQSRLAVFAEMLKFSLGDSEKVNLFQSQLEKIDNQWKWKLGITAVGAAALAVGLYEIFKSADKNKNGSEE